MSVQFDLLSEFIDDLKAEIETWPDQEGCAIDDKVVRISVSKTCPTGTQTAYSLTAGFCSLGELRQLNIDCGMDFKDCGDDALKTLNAAVDQIKAVCTEKGLQVRGGKFQDD